MGKGGGAPEAPNLEPIEKGWRRSTKGARRLANQHYNWAKKQNRKNWDVATPIIERLTAMMNDTATNAAEDRASFERVFDEYEANINEFQGKADQFSASVDKLKADALEYGSGAHKQFAMGQAQAGVATAMGAAKANSERTLLGYGVDPSSGRFRALDAGLEGAGAAAMAGAGTKAGMDVAETSRKMFDEALTREMEARGLDKDVLAMRGGLQTQLAGQSQAGTQLAGQLGESGAKTQLATSELANKQRVDTNEFLRTLNQGLTGWGDMLNTSYANSVDAYKAEQESSTGIGGLAGIVAPFTKFFAEDGGTVPGELSPSAGAIPDDVPTMLTAGEFVFPREAVEVMGMDKLYKMRDKAVQMHTNYAAADEADQAIPETV